MADTPSTDRLPLAWLAWATALLPLITIHLSYWLSAQAGLVPWCWPWFDGCTSISRASREGAAYFVYKGLMLPSCVLMVGYWLTNRYWLAQLGGQLRFAWLGILAALFLALYSVVLGHIGDIYHLLRRIGVVGFFGLTYLAQLHLNAALLKVQPAWGRRLMGLSLVTLAVGLASVVATVFWYEHYKRIDDAVEWSLAVLINLHVIGVALAWQRSGLHIRFTLRQSPP